MEIAALSEADFRAHPALFVELAHEWAAGGSAPEYRYERCLADLPRPLFPDPIAAREALWGLLSYPERGRALAWLDKMGILEEMIPAWGGNAVRRALRLSAVEEVHRERWAAGMDSLA